LSFYRVLNGIASESSSLLDDFKMQLFELRRTGRSATRSSGRNRSSVGIDRVIRIRR
jgi:hypothetical protein